MPAHCTLCPVPDKTILWVCTLPTAYICDCSRCGQHACTHQTLVMPAMQRACSLHVPDAHQQHATVPAPVTSPAQSKCSTLAVPVHTSILVRLRSCQPSGHDRGRQQPSTWSTASPSSRDPCPLMHTHHLKAVHRDDACVAHMPDTSTGQHHMRGACHNRAQWSICTPVVYKSVQLGIC